MKIKYLKITIQRLWHDGTIGIRDYKVKKAKTIGCGLKVHCRGEVMTIEHQDLDKGVPQGLEIKSTQVEGQVFDLVSFPWKPDEEPLQYDIFTTLQTLQNHRGKEV